MIRIMAGTFLFFALASCGFETSKISDPYDKITSSTFSNEAIVLEKQKVTCLDKSFDENQKKFNLHLFLAGRETSVEENVSPLFQGLLIQDQNIIKRTTYAESVELLYAQDKMIKGIVREYAKDVNICPEEKEFSQDSIESAALNAAYFIRKTNLKIKSIANAPLLPPITLSISPLIQRSILTRDLDGRVTKSSSYWTDNALYMPSTDSIVYLPLSRKFKSQGFSLKFWEIPMVASHEYGHHVFKNIYGAANGSSAHTCFDLGQKESPSTNLKSLQPRNVTVMDVHTGLNEGFADLISYYTLGKNERGVSGISCLQVTRDVGSSLMINGKEKSFNLNFFQDFFSTYPDYLAGGCDNPSYQESHILGAIFAHSADKFLSYYTHSTDQKLFILMDWVRSLRDKSSNLKRMSPRTYLDYSMKSFLTISLKALKQNFTSGNCSRMDDFYPHLNITECTH